MAILNNGILGPVANKVGSVIGRNFRGLNVITQLYNTSQKPATTDQKREQARLGMLSSFLSTAQGVIDEGFLKTVKTGQSPLNAAYSFNYRQAFVEQNGQLALNYSKIVFSRGPVERPNCATVKREGNKIIFTWLPQAENKFNRFDDVASFLLYNLEKKKMKLLRHKVLRSELKFEFELAEPLLEDNFHSYMLFTNQSGKLIGNSEYVVST